MVAKSHRTRTMKRKLASNFCIAQSQGSPEEV